MSELHHAKTTAERIFTAHDLEYIDASPTEGRHEYCVRGPNGDVALLDLIASGGDVVARGESGIRARSTNGGFVGTVGARDVVGEVVG